MHLKGPCGLDTADYVTTRPAPPRTIHSEIVNAKTSYIQVVTSASGSAAA